MFKLVVLLSVAAMAAAKPGVLAPVVVSSVVPGSSSLSEYSTSINHGSPALYRAPAIVSAPVILNRPAVVPAVAALSQAPYQPAVILDPINGVPLDTPEVVAARAAHYRARALGPLHSLRKRSVGIAPLAVVSPISYARPLVSNYAIGPVALSAPLGLSSVYPRALSWHPY